VTIKQAVPILMVLLSSGCMTPAGKPMDSSSCSFEQVWDATATALGDFPLEMRDKTGGVLETKWVEVEAATRAGALQRDVNRERLKYVVEVKPDGRGAIATVVQFREGWSPMGVQSRQWRAIPGNPSEEEALTSAITKRLKEKGC
jgi:hypothetical protein